MAGGGSFEVKTAKTMLVIMCTVLIIGLALVFKASYVGKEAGSAALKRSGMMDTEVLQETIDGAAMPYRVSGIVATLLGGSGLLVSGYVYKTHTAPRS